jgi:hypothetical protein
MATEKLVAQPTRMSFPGKGEPGKSERTRDDAVPTAARRSVTAVAKSMAMKLTPKLTPEGYRGPLRLWIVGAVIWIAGTFGTMWYLDHARPAADEGLAGIATRADCQARARQDRRMSVETCAQRVEARAARQRNERLIWAFLPPLLLLPALAAAVVWVVRGFRRDLEAV